MAKAKKLPSGNWRVRVYSHTTPDGKKHYESFTASTKQQAEMMVAKFANDNDRQRSDDLTAEEAMRKYVEKNRNVLSPSTLYGYNESFKRLKPFYNLRIRKINSSDMQSVISHLVEKDYSAKTIKNTYGFLRSSLTFCGIDKNFMVHLPSNAKKPLNSPESAQIIKLYKNARPNLQLAILLGCLSLRRGEISALKYKDINGNELYIHSDYVWGDDKQWHYKEVPKTDASSRIVYLPDFILAMIGTGSPENFIIDIKPNAIGNAFLRLKKKLGIDIRFHDLRHYFASLAKVLDIPDNYTANLGGWRNGSKVLKDVYQNNIVSMNEMYAKRINEHLEDMTQNMSRRNKNTAQP